MERAALAWKLVCLPGNGWRPRRSVLLVALAVSLLGPGWPAGGQIPTAGPQIGQVHIGLAGRYRVGHWTPVRVTIRGGDRGVTGRLHVTVPDGQGVRSVIVCRETRVAPGQDVTVMGYVPIGRVRADLSVALVDDGRTVCSRYLGRDEVPEAVRATQQLVLTLGARMGMQEALLLRRGREPDRIVHGIVSVAAELPDSLLGYDGVNLIVLSTSSTSPIDEMSARQLNALDRWVRLGGRIILSVGRRSGELLAPEGRLARFAPGIFDRVAAQRETRGLESFAGSAERLDAHVAPGDVRFEFPLTLLRDISGRVQAYEGFGGEQRPTVIQAAYGFGQVVFVGFDLDLPPLAEWTDGRPRLVSRLIDLALGSPAGDDDRPSGQLSQMGFNDLAGQLRGALDHFDGVLLVPFSVVAVLVCLYIVLIGPGDYLLLRRFGGRFAWTWFTFPLIVAASCLLAGFLALRWKGDQLRLNQVDLVDVDLHSGLTRGLVWSTLFSARSQTFDLSLHPGQEWLSRSKPSGQLLSWQGLPGKYFGGMDTTLPAARDRPYRLQFQVDDAEALRVRVRGLPIGIWSSRSLAGMWWGDGPWPAQDGLVSTVDGQLRGTLQNPLGGPLEDAMLCFQRWAYPLGTLAARQQITIDRASPTRTLDWLLTRTRVVNSKDVSTPWNRRSLDVPRILEMMMFYQAAGGSGYTRLFHRHQPQVDLSGHLQLERAVLVGRVSGRAAELVRDGEPLTGQPGQHWTFVRLLFPVRRAAAGEE
jgi:hypothetical protein